MNSVFLLWHTHKLTDRDDEKLLGVFSTNELAHDAKKMSETLEGFRDHIDGFDVVEFSLDKRQWTEGFVTESWIEDEKDIYFEFLRLLEFKVSYFDIQEESDPNRAEIFMKFENDYSFRAQSWRIFGKDVRLSTFDHNKIYGMPKPINVYDELQQIIKPGMLARSMYLDCHSGDLNIEFENGLTLQCLNLTAYEEWISYSPEGETYSNQIELK